MKIECLIRRKKGTLVEFKADGAAYHFTPDEEGRHVADVDNEKHAERLLSIKPEAYIKYGTEPTSDRYKKNRNKTVDLDVEKIDLEDLTDGTDDSVNEQVDSSDDDLGTDETSDDLNADDMKALIDDDEDDDLGTDNETVGATDQGDDVVDYEALSEDELKEVYAQKFGKKPHHKMKLETILEQLNESEG